MSDREITPDAQGASGDDAKGASGDDARGAGGESAAGASGAGRDLDAAQARLAYSIIRGLLEHTRVTGDLVALMAQALQSLDEELLKSLTNTPHWAAYLDSRRALEQTREQVEQFTEIMTALGGEGS